MRTGRATIRLTLAEDELRHDAIKNRKDRERREDAASGIREAGTHPRKDAVALALIEEDADRIAIEVHSLVVAEYDATSYLRDVYGRFRQELTRALRRWGSPETKRYGSQSRYS